MVRAMGTALGARHMSAFFDGAIPNTDAMRGKNGRGTRLAVARGRSPRPRLPTHFRQIELGAMGAYRSSLVQHGLLSPDVLRPTPIGAELADWMWAKGEAGDEFDSFVRECLKPGTTHAIESHGRTTLKSLGRRCRLSMIRQRKRLAGAARRAPDRRASAADRAPGCCQRWRDGRWTHALTAWPTHAPSLMGWRQASGASPRRWRWLRNARVAVVLGDLASALRACFEPRAPRRARRRLSGAVRYGGKLRACLMWMLLPTSRAVWQRGVTHPMLRGWCGKRRMGGLRRGGGQARPHSAERLPGPPPRSAPAGPGGAGKIRGVARPQRRPRAAGGGQLSLMEPRRPGMGCRLQGRNHDGAFARPRAGDLMGNIVTTDALGRLVGAAGACHGAVFLSYTFDARFFEEEVLAAVLQLQEDPTEATRRFLDEGRRKLVETPVLVIADPGMLRGGQRLPYDLLRADTARLFHPKLALLLYGPCARMVVGSGNLTPGGYGDNARAFQRCFPSTTLVGMRGFASGRSWLSWKPLAHTARPGGRFLAELRPLGASGPEDDADTAAPWLLHTSTKTRCRSSMRFSRGCLPMRRSNVLACSLLSTRRMG